MAAETWRSSARLPEAVLNAYRRNPFLNVLAVRLFKTNHSIDDVSESPWLKAMRPCVALSLPWMAVRASNGGSFGRPGLTIARFGARIFVKKHCSFSLFPACTDFSSVSCTLKWRLLGLVLLPFWMFWALDTDDALAVVDQRNLETVGDFLPIMLN